MAYAGIVPELYCSDLARSLDFYENELGFTVVYERPEDSFAFLKRENAQIMLEEITPDCAWVSPDIPHPFGQGVNFEIGVRNAEALYNRLKANGHAFFLPLEEKWYRRNDFFVGNRHFIIQDPDGYLLRFAEHLGTKKRQDF